MSDWLEDLTVKSDPADAIDVDGEADSAGEEAAGGLKVVEQLGREPKGENWTASPR